VFKCRTARALEKDNATGVTSVMNCELNKKRFIFSERINPELMGGMILNSQDTMWDGSLRANSTNRSSRWNQTSALEWTE